MVRQIMQYTLKCHLIGPQGLQNFKHSCIYLLQNSASYALGTSTLTKVKHS